VGADRFLVSFGSRLRVNRGVVSLDVYQWRTQEFCSGGGGGRVQQIQLRTGGRENGDLGAVAPYSGVPLSFKISETCILIRLLRMYFPRKL
jgi:hypothetical protein